ncbi:hypothetical protein I4F81_012270 [Pyropia yezoensis]|uniref:Uncharacterized protein n=1 Tax=Pyropia yezoensis TaxID=2788 RepID=A0ACC3CHX3_PYRYE|nr:hypothetical protein I4F81_012270 [Neopyropia yezoensis]
MRAAPHSVSPVPSASCRRRLSCVSWPPGATATAAASAATLDEMTAPGGSRLVCAGQEAVCALFLPCFCPPFCCDTSVMPSLAASIDLAHHTHLIMHARAMREGCIETCGCGVL